MNISRRNLLSSIPLGLSSIALTDLVSRSARANDGSEGNPLAPRKPDFFGNAKNVIFLFMQGGPSHLETFDYKPALVKHDGQLLPKELQEFDLAQTTRLTRN